MRVSSYDIKYEPDDEVESNQGVKGKVISKYCVQYEIQVEFENGEVLVFNEFGIGHGGHIMPQDKSIMPLAIKMMREPT